MLSTQSFQRTYSSVNNTIHGEPFGRDGSMSGVFYAFYGIRYTEVRSFEDIRKNGISVNTRPKSMTAEDLYNLIPLLKDYEQSQGHTKKGDSEPDEDTQVISVVDDTEREPEGKAKGPKGKAFGGK